MKSTITHLWKWLPLLITFEQVAGFSTVSVTSAATHNSSYTVSVSPSAATEYNASESFSCRYMPGYRLPKRSNELRCCKFIKGKFYRYWYLGGKYLTTFLETLNEWECPQLESECKNRYFDFTPFTNLAYMRVCNPAKYRTHCSQTVSRLITSSGKILPQSTGDANATSDEIWQRMVSQLNSRDMTHSELMEPCTQVALYEGPRGGFGRYHESAHVMIPFCGFVWCGYDADTIYGRDITVWTCMPMRCRVGVGISVILIACLGVATFAANVTVIGVYCIKKRMCNSQAVYKVTLAVGDTLVGVVVFPTFISTFYFLYMTRERMGDIINSFPNATANDSDLQPLRKPEGSFDNSFSQPYFDAVGFFTSLSIVLSVYTLMLASFDRMSAVIRPLSYNRRLALSTSKYACAVLLVLGLLIASLPVFTSKLQYGLVASILVSLFGEDAVILYTVAFLLPLLLVWVTSITLYIYSKRHTRVRRRISSTSNSQCSCFDRRLAKTLGIMVGVFTLSILPAAVTLVSSFFLDDIYYRVPEKLSKLSSTVYVSVEFVSVVILATNSLWNCFIYSSRHAEFRKAAMELYSSASSKVGVSAIWRTVRRVSNRRLTTASTQTSISTKMSEKSKESICSEIEKQDHKPEYSTSTMNDHHNEIPNTCTTEDATLKFKNTESTEEYTAQSTGSNVGSEGHFCLVTEASEDETASKDTNKKAEGK